MVRPAGTIVYTMDLAFESLEEKQRIVAALVNLRLNVDETPATHPEHNRSHTQLVILACPQDPPITLRMAVLARRIGRRVIPLAPEEDMQNQSIQLIKSLGFVETLEAAGGYVAELDHDDYDLREREIAAAFEYQGIGIYHSQFGLKAKITTLSQSYGEMRRVLESEVVADRPAPAGEKVLDRRAIPGD